MFSIVLAGLIRQTGVERTFSGRAEKIWSRPSLLLALASLILHLLANGHYGFSRDELYLIVCGSRPDWGYVDQPAVVPLLAAWSHALFGDSVLGFRLLPALAMAATVALTAEFTRLIGGGRFAQWVAGSACREPRGNPDQLFLLAGWKWTERAFLGGGDVV